MTSDFRNSYCDCDVLGYEASIRLIRVTENPGLAVSMFRETGCPPQNLSVVEQLGQRAHLETLDLSHSRNRNLQNGVVFGFP